MTEEDVKGMSPAEIILACYERAIKDLETAGMLFMHREGDPRAEADAIHLIVHAQQIVAELNQALDKAHGEVAENLARVYEYMQYRLTEAVAKRDPILVEEVTSLLESLRKAWAVMVENLERGEVNGDQGVVEGGARSAVEGADDGQAGETDPGAQPEGAVAAEGGQEPDA